MENRRQILQKLQRCNSARKIAAPSPKSRVVMKSKSFIDTFPSRSSSGTEESAKTASLPRQMSSPVGDSSQHMENRRQGLRKLQRCNSVKKAVKNVAVLSSKTKGLMRSNSSKNVFASFASGTRELTRASSVPRHIDSPVEDSSTFFLLAKKKKIPIFSLNEIQMGDVLGEGSFAKVYKITGIHLQSNMQLDEDDEEARRLKRDACHERGSIYAIKMSKQKSWGRKRLCRDQKADAEGANMLAKEAALLALLRHDHIIEIHGMDTTFSNSNFFFMVRLLYTLDEQLDQWRKSLQLKTSIEDMVTVKATLALQIADALSYLHEHHIVFRDLKPANIGFQDEQTIKLFDFGLSRKLPTNTPQEEKSSVSPQYDNTYQMSIAGSTRYMAPEILNTGGVYNAKVDVYSWAVTFHHMITLVKPYSRYGMDDYKEFVCELGERPELSGLRVPVCIKNILIHGWDQDAVERWTMDTVCEELQKNIPDLSNSSYFSALPTTLRSFPAKTA